MKWDTTGTGHSLVKIHNTQWLDYNINNNNKKLSSWWLKITYVQIESFKMAGWVRDTVKIWGEIHQH